MDRNKILITVLAIVGIMFVGLIFQLTNQSQQTNPNQTINYQPAATRIPPDGVYAVLEPEVVTTSANQTFVVKLNYHNLKRPLQGADLILEYNPEILSFERVQNSNIEFINARALTDPESGRLIVSFVEKADQQEPVKPELMMAELVFFSKKIGQATLSPVLNKENNNSIAIIKGSSTNKLLSVNPVIINIK